MQQKDYLMHPIFSELRGNSASYSEVVHKLNTLIASKIQEISLVTRSLADSLSH